MLILGYAAGHARHRRRSGSIWKRHRYERTTESCQDHADGSGFLALEDLVERNRAGPVHRAGRRPHALRCRRHSPRSPHALGARFPRYAGRPGLSRAQRRPLFQHRRDRPVPRSRKAVVRRWNPRDGERPPVSILGPPDRGAAHRAAAERNQDRSAGTLRRTLR